MTITLFDTMAGEKRVFEPEDPKRVTMYVCGPTVYNHAHIGNFRPAVVFDLLFRLLREHYGIEHVQYARNITDIEDKIIKAAKEAETAIEAITSKYAGIYRDETAAFNVLSPTLEPAATDHVPEMVALVTRLIEAGHAYAAQQHVLFNVGSFEHYGALSNVDRDEILAGARVDVAPYKEDPADFVLWKPSKDDEPGWESPWGRGRPGWHLECSAMIEKNLGTSIDIHAGGQDLRFPHHENEIAQSSCSHNGAPLARYWLHNGFLSMGKDKMSKSLGNVLLPRDLLKKWHGEVLRWGLLSAHYRQPLEWTDGLLVQCKKQLDRFYRVIAEVGPLPEVEPPKSIVLALYDDLNTPEAFAGLHELRDLAMQMEGDAKLNAVARLVAAGKLMGFFAVEPDVWFKGVVDEESGVLSSDEIEALLVERAAARKEKNFARADEIRDQFTNEGIVIEDSATGVKWRRE